MAQTINYHNTFGGTQDTIFTLLSSICFTICMIITVLGIKIKWFKQHLNFELANENDQTNHKNKSRSTLLQNYEPIEGVFRIRTEDDNTIERPASLPPIRITSNMSSKSQLFLIRRNLRMNNIIEPSPPPFRKLLSKSLDNEQESLGDPHKTENEQQQQPNRDDDLENSLKTASSISILEQLVAEKVSLENYSKDNNNDIPDITVTTHFHHLDNISDNTVNSPSPYYESDAESLFSVNIEDIRRQFSKIQTSFRKNKNIMNNSSLTLSDEQLLSDKNENHKKYSNQLHVNPRRYVRTKNIQDQMKQEQEQQQETNKEKIIVDVKQNSDSDISSSSELNEYKNYTKSFETENHQTLSQRKFEKFQSKPRPQPRKYLNSNGKSDSKEISPKPLPRTNSIDKLSRIGSIDSNYNEDTLNDDDIWSKIQMHRNITQKFAGNVIIQQQQQQQQQQDNIKMMSSIEKRKTDDESEKIKINFEEKPRTIRDMKKSQESAHNEDFKLNLNLNDDDAEA